MTLKHHFKTFGIINDNATFAFSMHRKTIRRKIIQLLFNNLKLQTWQI
jgi:hypothetical protein